MANELYHHGVLGQKWGVRRYQNKDGTLTEAGKKKLSEYKDREEAASNAKWDKRLDKSETKMIKYGTKGLYAAARFKDRKAAKYEDKYVKAKRKNLYQQAMKATEGEAIRNLTYKDMQKEKRTRVASVAANALVSIGSLTLAALGYTPVGVVTVSNLKNTNTNMRVNKQTQDNIRKSVYSIR